MAPQTSSLAAPRRPNHTRGGGGVKRGDLALFSPGLRLGTRRGAVECVAEYFVDFIAQRDERRLTSAAAKLSEKAFRKVWDNPRDAAYDRL
jgi:hypothetical protein